MRYMKDRAVAPLGAVLCVCACLVGCERRESVPSAPASADQSAATSAVSRAEGRSTTATIEERVHDPVYQKQLKEFGQERTRILQRRAVAERRMAQLRERAKAALPSGATDAQVEAELEANPTKYRAWRELVAAWKASVADEEKLLAVAQAAVARRISRKETGSRAQGSVPEVK